MPQVEVVQGEFRKASENKELGVFGLEGEILQAYSLVALPGISPAPAGLPQIEVTDLRYV